MSSLIDVDWAPSPFEDLEQARRLFKPHCAIYVKHAAVDKWYEFIVVRDEDDRDIRHVIAQMSGPDGRHGPVMQGELDVPILSPDHRCLRTGQRYTSDWHNNPSFYTEPTPQDYTLIAQGTYKAFEGERGSIHEVLYDEEGNMFWRILSPPVK